MDRIFYKSVLLLILVKINYHWPIEKTTERYYDYAKIAQHDWSSLTGQERGQIMAKGTLDSLHELTRLKRCR